MSKLAKSFADALTAHQLSDFLIWSLYYDIVELPESPEIWYASLSSTDIHGWISLGTFLSQMQAMDAGYGLDLVILDSICDRLNIHRPLVHEILIRFAYPNKMAFGILATTVRRAEQAGMAKLPLLVEVQAKLHAMHQLASRLAPTPDSEFFVWKTAVLKRTRQLLYLVIGLWILHARDGTPLLTAATSERLPKEALDGIKLKYLFELVQLERKVPMARYGGHIQGNEETLSTGPDLLLSSLPKGVEDTDLLHDIQMLREEVAHLTCDNQRLVNANNELTAKLNLSTPAWSGSVSPPTSLPTPHIPSSTRDEQTPTSTPSQFSPSTHTPHLSDSPTLRLSDPQDFDLRLAITLSSSPPSLPERHPARLQPAGELIPTVTAQSRHSEIITHDGLHGLGIEGVAALMLEQPSTHVQ
ncbi:hypothetical protein N0V94_002509 [Neodidymelliopsis sp. IMI 364377]|nr:hypothetical protein N0V94_002509 [Neodidymelliopsis sp. IMI 364377]